MATFRARDILGNSVFRQHAVKMTGPSAFPLHQHDFHEVFWVARGNGEHVLATDRRPLEQGTLVFIRPFDQHGFAAGSTGFTLHNVAFKPSWFADFRRRHFTGERMFWSGTSPVPTHLRLGESQLNRLGEEFADLGRSARRPRDAERFLLNLLHLSVLEPRTATHAAGHDDAPSWLEPALRAWADPREWHGGTRALARLAGRSEEHVARVVRAHTGRCPTDLLNAHRMRHAAHLLAATDRKVLDVALECGCASLGHFYALFHRHHGCAPANYRRRQLPRPV